MNVLDRYRGSLLGLATGDALGTTLEFSSRDSLPPVQDMVGGGPFALQAGEWTDDTSMALCLAASLVERGGFDAVDQLERYDRWWREGYMSSNGTCFDIGNTVSAALLRFEHTRDPESGPTDPTSAGNGSVMRLGPVPLFFASSPLPAIRMAAASSKTTHGAPQAVDACRYLAALIVGALLGENKDTLLSPEFDAGTGAWRDEPLEPAVADIASGAYKAKSRKEIRSSGYVIDTVQAALWAFNSTQSFEEGALLAVNLAEDADTVGAVYGQLAGAYYGVSGIPNAWLGMLAERDLITGLADGLYEASKAAKGHEI